MPIDAFPTPFDPSLTSTRAKTYRLLLASAMTLYDEGAFPSITELAAHAQVSRATAYRYFPTQSALISAVVAESLGPILEWRPQDDDALKRIQQLLTFAYPQMERHEGALRAALQREIRARQPQAPVGAGGGTAAGQTAAGLSAESDSCFLADLRLGGVSGAERYLGAGA